MLDESHGLLAWESAGRLWRIPNGRAHSQVKD